jgi:hypothetical protein
LARLQAYGPAVLDRDQSSKRRLPLLLFGLGIVDPFQEPGSRVLGFKIAGKTDILNVPDMGDGPFRIQVQERPEDGRTFDSVCPSPDVSLQRRYG